MGVFNVEELANIWKNDCKTYQKGMQNIMRSICSIGNVYLEFVFANWFVISMSETNYN